MEPLEGAKSTAQVAKAYGLHPNTANNWKQRLLESRPEIYAEDGTEYERRIANKMMVRGAGGGDEVWQTDETAVSR
jgi:transposase-like protein